MRDSWRQWRQASGCRAPAFGCSDQRCHELMEGSVDPALLKFISQTSENCPGIKGVDKVWVRKLGMRLMVDLHVEVDPNISRAGRTSAIA